MNLFVLFIVLAITPVSLVILLNIRVFNNEFNTVLKAVSVSDTDTVDDIPLNDDNNLDILSVFDMDSDTVRNEAITLVTPSEIDSLSATLRNDVKFLDILSENF